MLTFRLRNIEVDRITEIDDSKSLSVENAARAPEDQGTTSVNGTESLIKSAIPDQERNPKMPLEHSYFQHVHYHREVLRRHVPGRGREALPTSRKEGEDSRHHQVRDLGDLAIADLPETHRAAAKGDVTTLARLLNDSAKINESATIPGLFKLWKTPDVLSLTGCTPLHMAAFFGSATAVKWLLERGADKDAEAGGYTKMSPVCYACMKNRIDIVRLLLEAKASPKTSAGWSVHHACAIMEEDDEAITNLLLQRGFEVNSKEAYAGATPLMEAVKHQNLSITTALLAAGANIDDQTKKGCTALMFAAYSADEAMIQLLCSHGAKPHIESESNETAMSFALKAGNDDAAKALISILGQKSRVDEYEKEHWPAICLAAYYGNYTIVEMLVSIGTSIDTRTTALICAAQENHEAVLKLLLSHGASPNIQSEKSGATALVGAATRGHTNVVDILLSRGADPDLPFSLTGSTALIYAVEHGHEVVVEKLIAHRASVHSQNHDGHNALMTASGWGRETLVRMLLSAGAAINIQSTSGSTALMCAARYGHDLVLKYLLEKGAKPNLKDTLSWTALHFAAWYGHSSTARSLQSYGADCNALSLDGHTPLMKAAAQGHDAVVQALIHETKKDLQDSSGYTALALAAGYGFTAAVGVLLSSGADTESLCKTGWTALAWAARNGHLEIVKMLLANGARANVIDSWGFSALAAASTEGHVEVVRHLLEVDSNLEIRAAGGFTPLTMAAGRGHVNVVKLLVERGADTKSAVGHGWVPILCAAWNGHQDVVAFLVSRGVDVDQQCPQTDTALNIAVGRNHSKLARWLSTNGAKLSHRNKYGCCSLDVAARYGLDEMVTLLAEKGADVDARADHGVTPLMQAVIAWTIKQSTSVLCMPHELDVGLDMERYRVRYLSIVRTLLDWEAQSNARTNFGNSALHYAVYAGHEEMTELLLRFGADPDLEDPKTSWTSLHFAAARNNQKCIQILLNNGANPAAKTVAGETYETIMTHWNHEGRFHALQEKVLGEMLRWV